MYSKDLNIFLQMIVIKCPFLVYYFWFAAILNLETVNS